MPIVSARTGGRAKSGRMSATWPAREIIGWSRSDALCPAPPGCTCTSATTLKPRRLQTVPERAEMMAVEAHDAGVERVRVEIVVENEVDDPRAAVLAVSQQERTAVPARVPAALAQLRA